MEASKFKWQLIWCRRNVTQHNTGKLNNERTNAKERREEQLSSLVRVLCKSQTHTQTEEPSEGAHGSINSPLELNTRPLIFLGILLSFRLSFVFIQIKMTATAATTRKD